MSNEETWARLAEAATPGPWTVDEATEAKRFYMDTMPLTADVKAPDDYAAYGGIVQDGGPHVGACRLPDAEFIAAAREAVPALLTEVTRLRANADYSRFEVYATELDFDLECLDCPWSNNQIRASRAGTLQDMMDLADEHRREVHA